MENKHEVSKEDLENNVELVEEGVTEGEVIELGAMVQPNNLCIHFDNTKQISTITIKEEDVHKLARAFYDFCLDSKVDATIVITDK